MRKMQGKLGVCLIFLFGLPAFADSINLFAQQVTNAPNPYDGKHYADIQLVKGLTLIPTNYTGIPSIGSNVPILRLGFLGPDTVSGSTTATLFLNGLTETVWGSIPPMSKPFYFTFLLYDMNIVRGGGRITFNFSDGSSKYATFDYLRMRHPSSVPEPSSLVLLGSGLIGTAWKARKHLKEKLCTSFTQG